MSSPPGRGKVCWVFHLINLVSSIPINLKLDLWKFESYTKRHQLENKMTPRLVVRLSVHDTNVRLTICTAVNGHPLMLGEMVLIIIKYRQSVCVFAFNVTVKACWSCRLVCRSAVVNLDLWKFESYTKMHQLENKMTAPLVLFHTLPEFYLICLVPASWLVQGTSHSFWSGNRITRCFRRRINCWIVWQIYLNLLYMWCRIFKYRNMWHITI